MASCLVVWQPITSPSSLIVAHPEQPSALSVMKYGISSASVSLRQLINRQDHLRRTVPLVATVAT